MTELSVTDKLYSFRKEQEHFLGNSFDPIVSYGEHAAMNHYSATEETDVPIEQKDFYWQIPADIIWREPLTPPEPLSWDI